MTKGERNSVTFAPGREKDLRTGFRGGLVRRGEIWLVLPIEKRGTDGKKVLGSGKKGRRKNGTPGLQTKPNAKFKRTSCKPRQRSRGGKANRNVGHREGGRCRKVRDAGLSGRTFPARQESQVGCSPNGRRTQRGKKGRKG